MADLETLQIQIKADACTDCSEQDQQKNPANDKKPAAQLPVHTAAPFSLMSCTFFTTPA